MLIDGPATDHELVLKGRLASQAPDIDASVYLTDCDPSSLRAGDFVDVEIVGARGLRPDCAAGRLRSAAGLRVLYFRVRSLGVGPKWACAHFFSFRALIDCQRRWTCGRRRAGA